MSLDNERAATDDIDDIDDIDDQIVALMAKRQQHVRAAVRRTDAGSALDRRAVLMTRLRRRALEEGVDPIVVAVTYAAMVDAFAGLDTRSVAVGAR